MQNEPKRSVPEGKIREDVDRKRTFPELIFKQGIIEAHFQLLEAEEILSKFKEKTGKYNQIHVIILKGKIKKLFKMIKEMIKKSKKLEGAQAELYKELWLFSVNKIETNDVSTLMRYIDFLIYYLDELNLTNLLLPAQRGFMEKMKDEY